MIDKEIDSLKKIAYTLIFIDYRYCEVISGDFKDTVPTVQVYKDGYQYLPDVIKLAKLNYNLHLYINTPLNRDFIRVCVVEPFKDIFYMQSILFKELFPHIYYMSYKKCFIYE